MKICPELNKDEEMSKLETEKSRLETEVKKVEKQSDMLLKKEKSIKEDSKNHFGQAKYRKGLMDINKAIKKASVS